MYGERISNEEHEKILANEIRIGNCPRCRIGSGVIIIDFKAFGRNVVFVKCRHCGYSSPKRTINEIFNTADRFSTPTTELSIMAAINNSINDYKQGVGQ